MTQMMVHQHLAHQGVSVASLVRVTAHSNDV